MISATFAMWDDGRSDATLRASFIAKVGLSNVLQEAREGYTKTRSFFHHVLYICSALPVRLLFNSACNVELHTLDQVQSHYMCCWLFLLVRFPTKVNPLKNVDEVKADVLLDMRYWTADKAQSTHFLCRPAPACIL